MIDDLQIGPIAFDPGENRFQYALYVPAVVAHHDAGDARRTMLVVRTDF
jgi:hypothetical protein